MGQLMRRLGGSGERSALSQTGSTGRLGADRKGAEGILPIWWSGHYIGERTRSYNRARQFNTGIIFGLPLLSLLGGTGSSRTVEVLDWTGGFGVDVVRRRLLETTGDGLTDSIRVHLLGATVCGRRMRMTALRPGYYDTQAFGIPTNNLDCIGTINAFCGAVLWVDLIRQGIYLKQQGDRRLSRSVAVRRRPHGNASLLVLHARLSKAFDEIHSRLRNPAKHRIRRPRQQHHHWSTGSANQPTPRASSCARGRTG
ncbi:hypothetical protein F5B19DRAFT_491494 [Rostrohypoxylon terebratum]|nr:hypothetical protein F5B19DRAFT_491494 [Rostrohypoxylon terebratum]